MNRFRQQRTGRITLSATAHLPDAQKPGEKFELCVGLYSPVGGGPRLALQGADDGDRRIRLGTVELTGQANQVTGIRWEPHPAVADPYLARQNPDSKPVDFGFVRTAGGGRLVRQEKSLRLIPPARQRLGPHAVRAALGPPAVAAAQADAGRSDGRGRPLPAPHCGRRDDRSGMRAGSIRLPPGRRIGRQKPGLLEKPGFFRRTTSEREPIHSDSRSASCCLSANPTCCATAFPSLKTFRWGMPLTP